MGTITTYVCDVSGYSHTDKKEFVEVEINSTDHGSAQTYHSRTTVKKLVSRDVAKRLHLVRINEKEAEVLPEPTLESKFITLMKDYVSELAYEAGSEGASNVLANRA